MRWLGGKMGDTFRLGEQRGTYSAWHEPYGQGLTAVRTERDQACRRSSDAIRSLSRQLKRLPKSCHSPYLTPCPILNPTPGSLSSRLPPSLPSTISRRLRLPHGSLSRLPLPSIPLWPRRSPACGLISMTAISTRHAQPKSPQLPLRSCFQR